MTLEPGKNDKKQPSTGRMAIWIVVGAVGLYFVISGIYGALT